MTDKELIKWRNKVDLPEIRKKISEHISDMGSAGEWLKVESLAEQIDELQDNYNFRLMRLQWAIDEGKNDATCTLIELKLPEMKKEIERLKRKLFYLLSGRIQDRKNKNDVTGEMIARAKDFPIENMIEVKRGLSRCISGEHEDKHPSMSVKNNKCYCHSCTWKGDAIDVDMKLSGRTFLESVRRLCN